METIYSLILWDKMKKSPKDCQIHQMSFEEIEKDFISYLEKVGADQFKNDITENSFLDMKPSDLYYDGQFYEYTESFHHDQINPDPDHADRMLVTHLYHETMVEATVLRMMMEHMGPDSSEFLSRIHRAWFEKQKTEKDGTDNQGS